MTKTLRTFALALVATLALSGCLKMEINLELQSDDTVDGTMIFAVQEGLGEMLGDMDGSGEGLTDEEAAQELWGEELSQEFENATEEPYTEGEWVGSQIVFSGEPLTAFTAEADGFTITRDGDEFVVEGPYQPSPAEEEGMEELYEGAEMTMSITFPGTVSDHNGTLEGNTVTWDMLDPPAEIFARGDATGGGTDLPILLIVGILVAVIVIAAAVTFVVVRSRGGSNETSADPAHTTGNPMGDVPPTSGGPATTFAAGAAPERDPAGDPDAPEEPKGS